MYVSKVHIKKLTIWNFFFIVILIIVGLLCAPYSPDFINYINPLVNNIGYDSKFEISYWLILYTDKLFNAGWLGLYIIYIFLIVYTFLKAITKYSKNYILSIIVFILIFFPNLGIIQIRQGVAIGIFLLSIEDIINKNMKKYFFKSLIAVFFHYSAIILFLFYFISPKNINRIFYILLPFIGLLLSMLIFNLYNLELLTKFLPSDLKYKALFYITFIKTDSNSSINQINLINTTILYLMFIYYYFLFFIKFFDQNIILFLKFLGFGLFFWFAFSNIPVFSFRFIQYFDVSLIFLIPYLYKLFKNKLIAGQILIISLIFLFIDIYIVHCPFILN